MLHGRWMSRESGKSKSKKARLDLSFTHRRRNILEKRCCSFAEARIYPRQRGVSAWAHWRDLTRHVFSNAPLRCVCVFGALQHGAIQSWSLDALYCRTLRPKDSRGGPQNQSAGAYSFHLAFFLSFFLSFSLSCPSRFSPVSNIPM
jgi:hypothetical protein